MQHLKNAMQVFLLAASIIFSASAQTAFKQLRIPAMPLAKAASFKQLVLQQPQLVAIEEERRLPASCFQYNVGCTILPVQLLDFTAARLDDATAILKWATRYETGVSGYYIERSVQPSAGFEGRGFVAASPANTIKKNYVFNDPNDLTVTSYYRLRIADMDGSTTYSEVRQVKPVKAASLLVVYPNPATVVANLRITMPARTAAIISWADAAGKKVKEQNCILQPGINYFTNDIATLASGSYFVTVTTPDGVRLVANFFKARH